MGDEHTVTELAGAVRIDFQGGQNWLIIFNQECFKRDYRFRMGASLPSLAPNPAEMGTILLWERNKDGDTVHAVCQPPGIEALIQLVVYPTRRTSITIAAKNDEDLLKTFEWTSRRLPPQTPKKQPDMVKIQFWNNSADGAVNRGRMLKVPGWDEIKGNYPLSVQRQLDHMVNEFKPAHGGQLLLWHGPPGTGKTYAIRALARQWAQWCGPEYIVDPEQFFGKDGGYMLDVLLRHGDNAEWDEDLEDYVEKGEEKWKLVIFEDTGELLAMDARDRTGQGFSRLLNVVDGLLGQGLKALILITTNEELAKLHPAVSRPGRCASQIEFPLLSAEEATEWLNTHGFEETSETTTLANLYARIEGRKVKRPDALVGFGR